MRFFFTIGLLVANPIGNYGVRSLDTCVPDTTTNVCDACGLSSGSFAPMADAKNSMESVIEMIHSNMENFEKGDPNIEAFESWMKVARAGVVEFETLACIEEIRGCPSPSTTDCAYPFDGQFEARTAGVDIISHAEMFNPSNSRRRLMDKDFTNDTKLDIASNERPGIGLGPNNFRNTMIAITAVNTAGKAVAAAQLTLDAAPECGGAVSGDACAVATNIIKVAATTILGTANTALSTAQLRLKNMQSDNAKVSFDYQQINYDNGQFANHKLNEILCRWGTDGPDFIVQGQGCDGLDQDCNFVVDECGEDMVKPIIELNEPIPPIAFPTLDEAQQFLEENVRASDDCAANLTVAVIFTGADENCMEECEFTVTATDERCNGTSPDAEATRIYILEVDSTPAFIECGFFTPQNMCHVNPEDFPEFDPYGYEPAPFPASDDILHIDPDDFCKKDLINVNFWYTIDESGEEPINVTVTLSSNEVQGKPNDQDMGFIVKKNAVNPDQVERARIVLAPKTCHEQNGASFCEVEPEIETRVYQIKVETVDLSGNKADVSCNVIIIPDDHYTGTTRGSTPSRSADDYSHTDKYSSKSSKSGKCKYHEPNHGPNHLRDTFEESTQRNVIDTLEYKFDPTLDQTLTMPEPEPSCRGRKSGSRSGRALRVGARVGKD